MIPGLSRIPKALKGEQPNDLDGVPGVLGLLVTVNATTDFRERAALVARMEVVAWYNRTKQVRNLTSHPHPLAPFQAEATVRHSEKEHPDLHVRLDVGTWSPADLREAQRVAKAWGLIEDRMWKCTEALGTMHTFADYVVRFALVTGLERVTMVKSEAPWFRESSYDSNDWDAWNPGQVGGILLRASHRWADAGMPRA